MLRMPARLLGTLALLCSLWLSACGSVATDPTNGGDTVAPSIVAQPASQAARVGDPVNFSVVATGSEPLTYQWNKNGSVIAGATTASYTQTAAPEDDGAMFAVIVSNPAGTVQSAAAQLTVSTTPLAPTIAGQPADQTITSGQSATFSVTAGGTAPLSYQWQKNGSAIPGANAASYTTPAASSADSSATFTVVVSNSVGNVTSRAAVLTVTTVPSAPKISTQPANQSVQAGQSATFSVVATGSAPLSYQWRRNGTAIGGASGALYKTPATSSTDNGAVYSVVVNNAVGSITSGNATLTVTAAPSAPKITTQPANQSVQAGQSATFSVVATGSAPLSYQWRRNGTAIGGATGTLYKTPATSSTDNGAVYSVVVSNAVGSTTSGNAMLTVTAAPSAPKITTQPANQSVQAGQSATFSVVATGSAPLSYQWRRNGTAIGGATGTLYKTPATSSTDNGTVYSVVVSNAVGSTTSGNATLTVTAAPSAPKITTQPANQSVQAGQSATFSVVATGSAPLSYQWRRNGTAIGGATGALYKTPATSSTDNGAVYSVVVSNAVGSTTSGNATLTVTAAPSAPKITTQPANQSVQAGQSATFSVVATGSAPLSYQWRRNGTAIGGATGTLYKTPATSSTDNGAVYSVVVSNAVGSITSANATLTVTAAVQGTDVVTYKNDAARIGANLTETRLTPANVNASTFGKLHFLSTDGKVDAQPLYLSGLNVGGSTHNVVFTATENDSVYAFDADTGAQLWKVSLVPPGEKPSDPVNCDVLAPSVGVTATPVIDRAAGTLYLIAMTVSSNGKTYHHRLHALSLTTGAEVLGGPSEITASFPTSSGSITFDPRQYVERSGLLLLNGTIYTAWTSHCDNKFYTGWLMAYSASTLKQTAVLNVAPNSGGVGPAIWMSGGGIAADSGGNLYLITGNGAFEQTLDANGFPNMGDFGDSFLKISTAGGALKVTDYFSPSTTGYLSSGDLDLGSGGILLLPDLVDAGGTVRQLAVGAGKDGNIYVVRRDSMGHFSPTGNHIWQQLTGALGTLYESSSGVGGIWSTPAYFNGALYYCPKDGSLQSFPITQARLGSTPSSKSTTTFPYPGCSPIVSANGSSNGIVWAHLRTTPSAVLYAYDASDLGKMLYNSNQAGGRDQLGLSDTFVTPSIADGKVFVPQSNGVAVFGLL